MLSLIGLLLAAILLAVGHLVDNDAIFLAGSVLFVVCGIAYFKRS